MNPLVTIGIPTFKRLSYLKEAAVSALEQTYPNIEIIISQDATPDDLDKSIQQWSQALAKENSHVYYRYNQYNLGLAGNWNAIANSAQGDYLILIGDDDRLLPNFVETMVEAIQPNAQVAFSNHYIINSQGHRLQKESYETTQRYHRDRLGAGEIRHPEICVWQNSIPISAALIQTEAVQRLRFKEDLNTPEIELFIRLAGEGGKFVFVPQYLSEYRIHQHAATASGLWTEKLVNYLLSMPVNSEVEPYKRNLLSNLMVNATSRCLLHQEIDKAKELLASSYYPQEKQTNITRFLQKFCTLFPAALGSQLYHLIYKHKNTQWIQLSRKH